MFKISQLISHKFEPINRNPNICKPEPTFDRIPYYYNGRPNNNGTIFQILESFLGGLYIRVEKQEYSIITNTNQGSIVWYIDMEFPFIIKENLPKLSKFAITDSDFKPGDLWISKPSHPHLGSGKWIEIGSKKQLSKRRPFTLNNISGNWVLQPLLSNLILWDNYFKFDIRTYAVVYNIEDNFYGICYRYGVGRKCVNVYNPKKDPNSAITNISVQDKIPGYDPKIHLPLIYDDIGVSAKILKELIETSGLKRDPRKDIQFLILGLDIIFLDDGSPKLIEVNANPYLNTNIDNNEKIAILGFICGAFGHLLPSLIKKTKCKLGEDWIQI